MKNVARKTPAAGRVNSQIKRPGGGIVAPASSARKRILLVDDHPMMRAGLAQLINKQPDMEICCEVGSPSEAITALSASKVDLLLTDLTMPGRSGLEFIKDIHALTPELATLLCQRVAKSEEPSFSGFFSDWPRPSLFELTPF